MIASRQILFLLSFSLRKNLSREIFDEPYKINLAKNLSRSNFLSFIIGSVPRSKSTESKTTIAPTAASATTSKAQTKAEIKEKKAESKKKKDPHGLKRPLSAYMLFNNSKRPLIKQEYPGKHSKTILLSRFSTF